MHKLGYTWSLNHEWACKHVWYVKDMVNPMHKIKENAHDIKQVEMT